MADLKEDLYMRNNLRENESYESMNCPVCDSNNPKQFMNMGKFNYVKCKNCDLIYQNSQPVFEHLLDRYDENYFEYEVNNHENFFKLQLFTLKDIGFESQYFPANGKKFLDIGCATGLLLAYVKKLGFAEYGIELCEESAKYAVEKNHVNVINTTLEEAGFEDNFFDVIHFSHLIEHLKDVRGFVAEVVRVLAPGGTIIVTTPRIDSPGFRLFRKQWRSAIPDHLQLFSKKTLEALLRDHGFQIEFQESWGFIPIDSRLRFVKKLADRYAKRFNRGDVICVVAKKTLQMD
ncbi:MAG: class I SAM-dependent methyltransferase [Spirochaetales bacterium]|nr:class I SAM-dependent methyltransferase [Spirochaetales bacterium]